MICRLALRAGIIGNSRPVTRTCVRRRGRPGSGGRLELTDLRRAAVRVGGTAGHRLGDRRAELNLAYQGGSGRTLDDVSCWRAPHVAGAHAILIGRTVIAVCVLGAALVPARVGAP
jgi:hypothetical protein